MNKNIKISGKILPRYNEIISEKALKFVQEIHERFDKTRLDLLNERQKRQKNIDQGGKLDFLKSRPFQKTCRSILQRSKN